MNKYKHLEQPDSDYNRLRDESKHGEDPRAQLLAEEGLLIDGLTIDQYFQRKDAVERIVGAHRVYKFTQQPAKEIINIGGVDYKLSDYGLENTFSENVDVTIPWLCIQKKIKRVNIEVELRKENELSI